MSAYGPPPAAVPAWIDVTRVAKGETRVMTSAISYVRPRAGHSSGTTISLLDGTDLRIVENYTLICRLLEGQDP